MRILTANDVRRALPLQQTIEAMKRAYAALSDGRAQVPLRLRLPLPADRGVSLFMPAFVDDDEGAALAVKVVSVFGGNPARGLPLIYAAVLVLDPESGRALALLEGGTLTAIRTGAASGAAIDLLARSDSAVAAVFGAGIQGRTQLEAACTVRRIERAYIVDPDAARASAFVEEMAGTGPIPRDLRAAKSAAAAVADADIICTATTSTSPVFEDNDLKPGVHISAIGSYTPQMQEVPAQSILRAYAVVDSRMATLAETGDLVVPIEAGLFGPEHIQAELGEIVMGRKPGRSSADQITYFKSVGVAVQDAVAARLALKNAEAQGFGQVVDF